MKPQYTTIYQYSQKSLKTINALFCGANYLIKTDWLGNWVSLSIEAGELAKNIIPHLPRNYPNPFNLSTTIEFMTYKPGPKSMRIFDISGRLINTLLDINPRPGLHHITWDGASNTGLPVASGTYLYALETGDEMLSGKLVLLRR